MDGGVRQEEMVKRLKHEVKEKPYRRHGGVGFLLSTDQDSVAETSGSDLKMLTQSVPGNLATPTCDLMNTLSNIPSNRPEAYPMVYPATLENGVGCTLLADKEGRKGTEFEQSDTVLLMFYLEQLLPFLFPFYRPSLLQGGRTWILEMMISSPVVRKATLCQSSYFFSLAQRTTNNDILWESVLLQTKDTCQILRQALQVINESNIREHLHGAVRIMASIIQVQRFEIAVRSFGNCYSHLNAALALFTQLVNNSGPNSGFNTVMSRLGPPSGLLPAQLFQVPSAEQAAFRFSSTLLILDDIIASTALQEQPTLYNYNRNLLGDVNDTDPLINLEAVVGCQNWALVQISEIAALDAWKQSCKKAGSLDIMELVRRATIIKDLLEAGLKLLVRDPVDRIKDGSNILDVFTTDYAKDSKATTGQSSLATKVWAHAASLYLFVVVSGWQPASSEVRFHVGRIIELLTCQISPPAILRTMVWPFCVAGCLAEPEQEVHFRAMVEALQPPNVFGAAYKALEIMEEVWRNRNTGDPLSRDLATCFKSQGDLVLLV